MATCDHANSRWNGYCGYGWHRRRCADCGHSWLTDQRKPGWTLEDTMRAFVFGNVKWMKKLSIYYDEAVSAGIVAFYEACEAGEVDKTHFIISKAGARYIRREMMRAGGRNPKMQNLHDYGFEHGQLALRGPRKPPKNKYAAYRHRNMAKGVCVICGKPRDNETTLCNFHREKQSARRRKYREYDRQRKAGAYRPDRLQFEVALGLKTIR